MAHKDCWMHYTDAPQINTGGPILTLHYANGIKSPFAMLLIIDVANDAVSAAQS
jgi:hypothetical protein